MSFRPLLAGALLVLLAGLAPSSQVADAATSGCPPCGSWRLASGDDVEAAVDAALDRYEPPRSRRSRAAVGDIAAETQAEFEASLDRPPPGHREQLRSNLLALVRMPEQLTLRLEGSDVVIESGSGSTRSVNPDEPHSRVDSLGTARISSRWRRDSFSITERYDRRTENRVTYSVDPGRRRLTLTRIIERRGLPELTVRSEYVPIAP